MPAAFVRRVLPALLLALLVLPTGRSARAEDGKEQPVFRNPYFSKTEWRVWRDEETPVEGLTGMVHEDKKDKPVPLTLRPVENAKRTYPVDPPTTLGKSPYLVFEESATPSPKYAGMWDDVYSSWSGLHGYVRTRWRGSDGSNVTVRGQIMDIVDARLEAMMTAGVNFIHQSTTGMAHAITNGRMLERTTTFEKLYFADLLVCSPAHASWTDYRADYTTDLYTAHASTLFNSVGSSNSETMAITKMAIVGAYLPPATKLLLKRGGLYPSALLYIWKAALPYDEPYDHELRHRIAYKAVGDRAIYSKIENYGAAGIDRGDMSLPYHCYDEEAHMRRMVDLARSMDVAPPEAVFAIHATKGDADGGYSLRKAAVVVQEPGKDVTVELSTVASYDLQGLPLTLRWKLLYGNKATTIRRVAEAPDEWVVQVPWDDTLPEGRTAIALVANNGRFDSNPAILTVYRKRADALPPSGLGPGDYAWPATFANRRPVVLGLQDRWVKRGKTLEQPLEAHDPEGQPVAFYKRGGEVGTIDGSLFTWACPRKESRQEATVTVIASDGTGGSSYGGEAFTIHVEKPAVLAQIDIDHLIGKAPLTVKLSAKPSIGSKLKYGWEIHEPSYKHTPKAFKDLEHARETSHTFEKPGIYQIDLAVEGSAGTDTESILVMATEGDLPALPAALRVEGNDVLVRAGDETPDPFDHTDFGVVERGGEVLRTFRVVNTGDSPLRLDGKPVAIEGPGAGAFRLVDKPRTSIAARGSALFTVRFQAREAGTRSATLTVHTGSGTYPFAIAGTAR